MRGPTHREWGAVSGALLSAAAGNDPLNVLVCAAVGYGCATWPDAIERDSKHGALRWFRPFSPFLKHRGMSHSWEITALFMLLAWALPPVIDYPVWAIALAWQSHLSGDFIFGKAGYGRRAGIPLVLGTTHIGLGIFKVGNFTEDATHTLLRLVKWPAVAVCVVWSVMQAGAI